MDNIFNQTYKSISLGILILLCIGIGYMDSHGADESLDQATFYVS